MDQWVDVVWAQANYRDAMDQWVTSRGAMQEHVAGCGRHVHYCECCLANMFGMPSVEAFLRVCLLTIKVCPPRDTPRSRQPSRLPAIYTPLPPPDRRPPLCRRSRPLSSELGLVKPAQASPSRLSLPPHHQGCLSPLPPYPLPNPPSAPPPPPLPCRQSGRRASPPLTSSRPIFTSAPLPAPALLPGGALLRCLIEAPY